MTTDVGAFGYFPTGPHDRVRFAFRRAVASANGAETLCDADATFIVELAPTSA